MIAKLFGKITVFVGSNDRIKLMYQYIQESSNFIYRDSIKNSHVVVRIFFLLLLNCSACPCLGPA